MTRVTLRVRSGWPDERLLAALKIAAAVVALASVSLALRPDRYVVDAPILEDSYYLLSVSRNVALGHGITIDGVHPTNGFQPLYMALSVPAFMLAGGDSYLSLRLVIFLEWLFYIIAAILVGLIGRDLLPQKDEHRPLIFWLCVLVYLASLFTWAQHFNGLETGLLLLCIALAWRYFQVAPPDRWSGLLGLGVILGIVVLARIDAAFLVLAVSFYVFWSRRRAGTVAAASRALVVGATAGVISAPWWLYNLLGFGSLMPSSGMAQELWEFSASRWGAALAALLQCALPFIYLGRLDNAVMIAVRLLFVLIGVIFWRRSREGVLILPDAVRDARVQRALEFAGCLTATLLTLAAWYASSSAATYFYARYLAPALLLSTIAIAYTLLHLRLRPWLPWIAAAFCAAMVLAALASTGLMPIFRGNTNYTEQLPLVNRYVPPGVPVASGQTGTLGYFRERVVNLDGKVNAEALAYRKDMGQYLRQNGVEWFCDWPANARYFLGENAQERSWTLVAEQGKFALYHFARAGIQ